MRAIIFRADLGSEAAVSGGAPYVVLRQVITVALGGVLQQREGGGHQSAQFFQHNNPQLDKHQPNLVNMGRLILDIVILAPEQRNFK